MHIEAVIRAQLSSNSKNGQKLKLREGGGGAGGQKYKILDKFLDKFLDMELLKPIFCTTILLGIHIAPPPPPHASTDSSRNYIQCFVGCFPYLIPRINGCKT